ncbi:endoplasmic reticulum junction formation protein lunapark-B [Ochlerotatus camptorhynchus]|uniref:endoplasmic reticulum junction formation protein lunapark-B n=1 Tax=Ochlerotatus camptorhynchus TaxID=644619 RepID=UPI0031E1EB47
MGAIISRFRKEKTTYQILENLEEKISDLEAYTISTQERQKRFVANFLVISIGLYVISFAVFYFVFFPPTWNERIIHSLPLLICPMIITLIKKGLAWYFERKVIINTNELKELRAEKKKILEKVMDKETYKVAVDILNKFGEKSFKMQNQGLSGLSPTKGPQPMQMTPKGPTQMRPAQSAPGPQMTPVRQQLPNTPIGFNVGTRQPNAGMQGSFYQPHSAGIIQRPMGMVPGSMQTMPYRRTPYPIINHNQKGVIEKMVDYLVGDGPNSRFAMICSQCLMHNGMALQEEYEYAAFRCAFCGVYNPSKKQRPLAPKLPFEQAQLDKLKEQHGSSSSLAESEPSSSEETASAEADTEVLDQELTIAPDQGDLQEDVMPEADMASTFPEEAVEDGDQQITSTEEHTEQSKAGIKAD